jgi:Xaa-Pro aminopeptidase
MKVAWLLNIRGADVAYCPVVLSHVAVTPSEAFLFVDESKLDSAARKHVQDAGYTIKRYQDFIPTVQSLAASGLKFWVDPSVTSWAVMCALGLAGGAKAQVEKLSPLAMVKAIKNPAEAKGMQDAHERDGVAMARFFSWLEKAVAAGTDLDEIGASRRSLHQARTGPSRTTSRRQRQIGSCRQTTCFCATPAQIKKSALNSDFISDIGGGADF